MGNYSLLEYSLLHSFESTIKPDKEGWNSEDLAGKQHDNSLPVVILNNWVNIKITVYVFDTYNPGWWVLRNSELQCNGIASNVKEWWCNQVPNDWSTAWCMRTVMEFHWTI